MGKSWIAYKKLHRWPGLIISFILLYYGFTGILLNHRELFSRVDLGRKIMPSNYEYRNWNNAALKGSLTIGKDSILVYGNIGIWLTDPAFINYTSFNKGLHEGSDNRRIFDIHKAADGSLYVAAFSGLFGYDSRNNEWKLFKTADNDKRFTGITSIGDTIYAVNRSYLFTGKSEGIRTDFRKMQLLSPPGYDSKVTLFQTIWQIHSGEIFGVPGKLFVDLLGLMTIFLSATGIIWFFFPGWIRNRFRKNKEAVSLVRTGKWSLRWHNKLGAWTFPLLILLFFTGMFLRPPLLIAIANMRVHPFKYTHLDQPNPWYDKLRDILYDPGRDRLFLASTEGIYIMDPAVMRPEEPVSQPPVSVMGITVFENYRGDSILVGSFSGIFVWDPGENEIYDLITGELSAGSGIGKPFGDYKVSGLITDAAGNRFLAEYGAGMIPLNNDHFFPEMPSDILRASKISLWSVCLEIHTGRIFESIFGGFYILIVPLAGLTGIVVVFSGYILWRRKYRRQGYDSIL